MKTRVMLVFVGVGLLVVGILLWQFSRAGRGLNTNRPVETAEAATTGIVGGGSATFGVSGQNSGVVTGTVIDAPAIDPEFQTWIKTEAKSVDRPTIDSDKKKTELAKIIATLTPNKAKQLLQTARNVSSTAGERILSTYLLVEAGSLALGEIKELITSPVVDHGPAKAHSEAEMMRVQERSLRIMAIDGLASRAKQDPNSRDTLARSIPGIQDSYIRDYAQKRLAEVSNR